MSSHATARVQPRHLVDVLHMTDPGCPWAWSASPALAELRWRFGDGLRWRNVMIGLTESAEQYEQRGYTPVQSALGHRRFRVYGMPFASHVKTRVSATAPDRKSTRLNSSHRCISYAVFCLKKKK